MEKTKFKNGEPVLCIGHEKKFESVIVVIHQAGKDTLYELANGICYQAMDLISIK